MKKSLQVIFIFIFALFLSGCGTNNTKTGDVNQPQSNTTKLLINELPLEQRPFSVFVPHTSNRIFTFFVENADKAKSAAVDVEYQSGDLLKAARATLESPIKNPYVKAIVLGSCSTGGKCSFDTDLKSGTMKLKLGYEGLDAIHVLKGDFTFVNGQNNLPDGKFTFEPIKSKSQDTLIMGNSFGLPKPVNREIQLYPLVISSVSSKNVVGTFSINLSDVKELGIYDGTDYQPLKFSLKDGKTIVSLNQKPWEYKTQIVRDDLKGAIEDQTLYLVGPIVVYK